MTSVLMALSWGGIMFSWKSYKTLLPLILGVVGLIGWALYSELISKNPMIPLRILADRNAAIHYYGNFVQGLSQLAMIYYLPIYYQGVLGYSPLISGVAGLPQCLLAGPSSAVAGGLINKTGKIKVYALFGWVTLTLGLGLLKLLDVNTSVAAWIFINVPSGLGLGVLFSTLAMATQTATEQRGDIEDIAALKSMAAALNPFFRALGQSIGIVAGQAAFTNAMKAKLGQTAANEAAALAQLVKTFPTDQQIVIKHAFVDSLGVVWWISVGLAASALVATLFAANHKIVKPTVEDEETKESKTGRSSTDADSNANVESIPLESGTDVKTSGKELSHTKPETLPGIRSEAQSLTISDS